MKINTIVVGEYQVNCYVLKNDNEVLLIDPGHNYEKIKNAIAKTEKVVGIVLTHGHFDHIGAVDELVQYYQCPVYIHPKDNILLQDRSVNSIGNLSASVKSPFSPLPIGEWNLGTFNMKNYWTPGHTHGSICIHIEDILFTGDTLFYHSIGRTDLFGGDNQLMRKTIQQFKQMNSNLLVYPGHGPITTIQEEIKNNPYF